MATLTLAASESRGGADLERTDDLSGHAHRQLIGYIGLVMPIVLYVLAGFRPTAGLEPSWRLLDSISAYYYSGATAAFVGLLVALSLFLFTYRGYANERRWLDRRCSIVAAVAALLVAFFPTEAPGQVVRLSWWHESTGIVHYVSAAALFLMFAVFSLVLFRMTAAGERPTPDKRRRNLVYLACGVLILIAIVWAGVAGLWFRKPIFWPETIALFFFSVSWLVKGQALPTIAGAARRMSGRPQV